MPPAPSALLAQDSWDLRLVAGADINAADALAVRPIAGLATGSGSLRLGNATTGYLARTGTGDSPPSAPGATSSSPIINR